MEDGIEAAKAGEPMLKKYVPLAIGLSAFVIVSGKAAPTDSKDMKDIKVDVSPAQPAISPYYVAVYGGANFSQSYGNEHASANIPGFGSGSAIGANSSNWGPVGGLKFGYQFRDWNFYKYHLVPAVEVEGLYIGSGVNSSYGTNFAGATFNSNSHTNFNNAAFFLNGILNFKNQSLLTPYLGIGVGGEYINADESHFQLSHGGMTVANGTSHANDFVFAAQGIVGIDARINERWSLFTEYKFIAAIDPSLDYHNIGGTGTDAKFHPDYLGQHLVTAGIKYHF